MTIQKTLTVIVAGLATVYCCGCRQQPSRQSDVTSETSAAYSRGSQVKNEQQIEKIFSLVANNDFLKLEEILNANPKLVNVSYGPMKVTPLHEAGGNKRIVELLLSKGAKVNVRDAKGKTPFFYSDREVSDLLLAKGANINERDNEGNTKLHYMARDDYNSSATDGAMFLLDRGANVNVKNNKGETPLDLAKDNVRVRDMPILLKQCGGKYGYEVK